MGNLSSGFKESILGKVLFYIISVFARCIQSSMKKWLFMSFSFCFHFPIALKQFRNSILFDLGFLSWFPFCFLIVRWIRSMSVEYYCLDVWLYWLPSLISVAFNVASSSQTPFLLRLVIWGQSIQFLGSTFQCIHSSNLIHLPLITRLHNWTIIQRQGKSCLSNLVSHGL